jgi:AcrR family transcriptional regulator
VSALCKLRHMAPTTIAAERPLRRDAQRNRELILEAARAAFAEDGLDIGLHEIARRAGVGVATVYRRFPDKDALIVALFEDRIGDVVVIAEEALAAPDAWDGLVGFFERTLELQAADRGLHQLVFAQATGTDCAADARERITPLVARLVERAQAEGALRDDVSAFDIGILRKMLGMVLEAMHEIDPEGWRRSLVLVLDGLRRSRRAPSPLPGRPLRGDEFDRFASS